MNRLCTATCLLAGLGGLTALAAPDNTGLPPLQGRHQLDTPNLSLSLNGDKGGAAGESGAECHWNTIPGATGSLFASQKDVAYPFYAESADDFVLTGTPGNPCDIETIRTVIGFFNNPVGVTPEDCWDSVKVTIYEDISFANPIPGASCPTGGAGGDPACPAAVGPGGFPCASEAGEDRNHFGCFFGAGVVCELKVPMEQVRTFEVATDLWEIVIWGLENQCQLEKDHTYWISIAPEQQFGVCGQTGILQAAAITGNPAQQIFALLGTTQWAPLAGDLAIEINGSRPGSDDNWCPGNTNGDKTVNVTDLLNIILCWGTNGIDCPFPGDDSDLNNDGTVDVQDLVSDPNSVILNWGNCPAPSNDECVGKTLVDLPLGGTATILNADMQGTTPSFELTQCVPPTGSHKDTWYCITYTGDAAADVVVNTTFDVFVEIYEGCDCVQTVLKSCGPGVVDQFIVMQPGDQCTVRLINDLNLPNDVLTGDLHLHATPQPPFGACCFNGGGCTDEFETDCGALGGTFQGEGTACNDGVVVCPVPDNDACVDRILLTDGVHAYDSTGATTDPSDPPFSCADAGCDIWYNYEASCDGDLTVSLCGTQLDTALELYDGWACPPTAASTLGCSDDFDCDGDGTPDGGGASELTIPVLAGQQIKIRVGGWQCDKGEGLLTIECQGPVDHVVGPGVDCWFTECGASQYNFGSPGSPPIPADFFGPGSDPFTGTVLWGNPQFTNPPGNNLPGCQLGPDGFSDTVVERQGSMEFSGFPDQATVDIELVQLCLKSCDPIVVTYNGGQDPEEWSVYVYQNTPALSGPGQMTATRTHETGGVFDSVMPVAPLFQFEQLVAPGLTPFMDPGIEFLIEATGVPFTCDGPPAGPCGPTGGFGAGQYNTPSGPCCVETCHDTVPPSDKLHCVSARSECVPCPPADDDCALAPAIVEVAGLTFDSSAATPDGAFPCFPPSPNVWICYVPTCTGFATIDTCGSNAVSGIDTTLCVYDGCAPGPALGANDDCPAAGPCPGSLDSCVTVPVVTGFPIKIEIGSLGPGGAGVLNITCSP